MSENRSNSFLKLIRRSQRGKLKIYLGYCAGVGKTYQMLLEARRLHQAGINVIIGYVETHGRIRTEELLNGLEILPRKTFTYRNIDLSEMDIDGVLVRKPEVVIVDELAHSNVPGSKNTKRYQDVEEILAAGIHVISTMNVQHLESLYDSIELSTAVKVKERVPDRILIEADQIVNVDISVEDLLARLQEGNIYVPEGIENALKGFFKPYNLEQLRELTLRELAAQIDFRRRDHVDEQVSLNPDQIMVCLSSRGTNREKLLRYASRLAGRLNRNWYAVYVQTPGESPDRIDAVTQRILFETLGLAKNLGATVFTYKGEDIVDTILQFAREYRVGHIVLGTPGSKPSFWSRLSGKKGITERLIDECNGITLVILDTRKTGFLPDNGKIVFDNSLTIPQFVIHHPFRTGKIILWREFIDRNEAIKELVKFGCNASASLNTEIVWAKVLTREHQGATYLNDEIGFPHCRIEGIHNPILVLGIAKAGILDPVTGGTVRFMILVLSPAENPDIHIKMIGYLAKLAGDANLLKQLLDSESEGEVMSKLEKWES